MRLNLFFILSLLGISGIAQTTRTCTGSTNTDWQTASNWSPSGVPAAADPVIINSTTNQPALSGSASIASLTVNSGAVLNLGSYNLTVIGSFTGNSATVNNGSLLTGSATVTNCTFGAKLTSSGGTIQLRNSTFNDRVTVIQTGSANTTSYGNTFNEPTRLTNSSAGFLSFGVGVADVFNDSLFATVTASKALYLAHSSAGNQFNSYVEFNKTSSATSTGVFVGSTVHSTILKAAVTIKSVAPLNWQSAVFTNCTFDSLATLVVNSGSFTHGQLSFVGCKIYSATNITLGSSAQLLLGTNTIVHNTFVASTASVILGAVEFKQHCTITKTGSSTDLSGGPVICRGTNLFKNSGTGLFWLGNNGANKFYQGLSVENSGAGTLQFTLTNAADSIVGTTNITTSAGILVLGTAGGANQPLLVGNIALNINGGGVYLYGLKQASTGTITASTFSGGLMFNGFKQLGTSPINLSGSGIFTVKSGSEFRGDVTVSAGRISVLGGEFFEEVFFNQTGIFATQGEGYPVFHKDVEFKCSGTGIFQLNYPHTTFTYDGNLILNNASGNLQLGYVGTHQVKGDVIFKGAHNINSWSNKIVLNGTLNQSIKREHNFTPNVLRLEINKPSGTATLETPLIVALDLSLQKGELHTTATNFPTLGSTATITGGSDSSYVVGPISKIGTAAFTFPTGGNGSYAPIGIDAVASSCTFKANYIAEDPDSLYPRSQKDTTLGFVNRCGYWSLDRTSGTQNTKVTLGWSNNPCFAPRPVDVKLSNWNSNSWNNSGTVSYQGNSQIGKVSMLNNYSGSYPLVANLTGKCYKDVTYKTNYDTLIYGLSGIVFITPGNAKEIRLEIDNSLVYVRQDSIIEFENFSNNSNLKLQYVEQEGCAHALEKTIKAKRSRSCKNSLETNPRVSCQCGTDITSFAQIGDNAETNRYLNRGYTPNGDGDLSTPIKRIGLNLIVVQDITNPNLNFQNIPLHSNALYDAFELNNFWSVQLRFLQIDPSSDPDPFTVNSDLSNSRIEFYIANLFFMEVSPTIFNAQYFYNTEQQALVTLARERYGCVIDERINYFLVKNLTTPPVQSDQNEAAGITDKPSCNLNFQHNVFSEAVYGNYMANQAFNTSGAGYGHWIYAFTNHAAHELGHNLDLNHTYDNCSTEDAIPDFDPLGDVFYIDPNNGNNLTCPHDGNDNICGTAPNPFINNPNDPCYTETTNNLMGALFLTSHHLSPLQIGKIHKATSVTSLRKYVDKEKNSCPYSSIPININTNETLYLDIRLYNDLIVRSGNTLTITCRVEFPDGAALVVEPGARLVLKGNALLTGACTMWKGVRVMGLQNADQGTFATTQQGVIEMYPGTTIENAEEAVFMGDINNNMSGVAGGVIFADGATFRNNYRSIAFHQYGQLLSQIGNPSFSSISEIKNCNFICNAHLKNPNYFNRDGSRQGSKHFVTMWDIRGVDFTDNTFENTVEYEIVSNCTASTYSWDDDSRGTGIGTFDAQFNLISTNPSTGQRNRFINLTRGI